MTGPFREGDIVAVDHMGRYFLAYVEAVTKDGSGDLQVKPLAPNITWFTVRTRDVKSLWRFSKGARPIVTHRGGITFGA